VLRLTVSPSAPDPAVLGRAAAAISKGGIVAIPTDTLYGLAADPFNRQAIDRLFALKVRTADRALPLIACDIGQIEQMLGAMTPIAKMLARTFWPGPLTLLIDAPEGLAARVTGGTGRVGVRVPAHQVARALCEICGLPLTATSANISGEPAQDDPERVAASIGEGVEMLIDAGRTPGGLPSTIVDVSGAAPVLVRAGAISWEQVEACLRHG
jgi:L-threonylcarbamoyladenylate synthase